MSTPQFGAGHSSGGGGPKYNILYGQWRKYVPEGTEGALDRINKNGVKVYELCFDNFSGYIRKVQCMDGEWGPNLIITMAAGEDDNAPESRMFILLYSAQARSFLNRILEADITKPIQLALWTKNDKTHLFVKEWKDETNEYNSNWWDVDPRHPWYDKGGDDKGFEGLPAAEPIPDGKGGVNYNYQPMTNVLTKELKKEILPHIQTEPFIVTYAESNQAAPAPAPVEVVDGHQDNLNKQKDDLGGGTDKTIVVQTEAPKPTQLPQDDETDDLPF